MLFSLSLLLITTKSRSVVFTFPICLASVSSELIYIHTAVFICCYVAKTIFGVFFFSKHKFLAFKSEQWRREISLNLFPSALDIEASAEVSSGMNVLRCTSSARIVLDKFHPFGFSLTSGLLTALWALANTDA